MNRRYRIENLNRPGFYWSSHYRSFQSDFGLDQKIYRSYETARKAAEKLSRLYAVAIREYN